mmetsp:Transcript_26533/g.71772  ORF Transcript_26533/g.71772 Transcript_26533/m.71772 type:complete len:154 (-) Transcript_26533:1020-1481(-)|eukprot:CAMPEP_0202339236 /NCGR_PEP_ID=MMETSP1126-20121109/1187_1 /ASSEMBLY_ACC=CAM_ASM_000457 /TAXON_ID=3047 /ORGANISM="Dunaliella tertiolecta, Strain CCMP1320" /LENGTH=153 /DNA_ID=CAMNT_0048929763 /DNA_START=149 /DNA_END=610 /DNA_ORIENTATION=+
MLAALCSQQAAGRTSLELEQALAHIDLEGASAGALRIPVQQQRRAQPNTEAAFSPNTSSLLSGSYGDKEEGVMRECFGEAFNQEVEYLSSLSIPVSKERKRQILADILVWAEVTQGHYDKNTRSFVLEPNQYDESFLRVGQFLRESKQQHGIP